MGKTDLDTNSTEMDNYQVRTLQKKRTTNFREDETRLLISLWGSPVIQNKLYLTHRKAPVMRLLAANMQQRGFYRSPDEIKTRIRNLKCLYHRIKRTMVTGTGLGTVDPDWPHFKAMDAILGKENRQKQEQRKGIMYKDDNNGLEGPRCEDIKQEVDLDIKDDAESWTGNDSIGGSDFEEHQIPTNAITKSIASVSIPVSTIDSTPSQSVQSLQLPVLPNISVSATNAAGTNGPQMRTNGTIPLPFLILNHGIQQPQMQEKKNSDNRASDDLSSMFDRVNLPPDLSNVLRQMLTVQKQQYQLDKQKFELEKQRLDFDRLVGTQLMTLVPMVGGLLQRLVYPVVNQTSPEQQTTSETNEADPKDYNNIDKSTTDNSDYDLLKDSKILRGVLERGIKKYMMSDNNKDTEDDNNSENEDSGINDAHLLIHDDGVEEEEDNSNSNSK